ncbi:mitochondrial fission ELM1 family protein [Fuerstiella marisgermanici]|uniref:Nucleoside-diphosphate sugar epimerase n=1 Tax=Fuerstiella marisgermanici TaxID=1891926 RepID=A0A1P8W935_9PLAN|nr:ELM1/GtrOC1 family putative glycosyltransferase [Fuerstiella marisgermanici]APZ90575.1 hypothetical protein Fuma_00155 [Fuerstiella marisgermanici]
MSNLAENRLSIWCLLDGKAGHQNQVQGCADAIQRLTCAEIHSVELSGWNQGLRSLIRCDRRRLPDLAPDLIIGAGHASHFPLCMFRWRFGGRSIVLMKPSLPLSLFDFCLIPDVHRLRRVPDNTILTTGVLNRVLPGRHKDARRGMFLVGGPSGHYRWDSKLVYQQICDVVQRTSDVCWTVATSRRTPDDFFNFWRTNASVARLVSAADVGPDWLPAQLDAAATVWVTEDSVSMTYEALTSGASVGILELVRWQKNRVTDCIDSLVDSERAVRWTQWCETRQLKKAEAPFSEADRCAALLLDRLFPNRASQDIGQKAA